MHVLKIVLKNGLRHKLRTFLTIVGIMIAVMSFGFMRTVVTAWNAGVSASAANRVISHHSVSIIFTLPIAYKDQLERIPGVSGITYANWFGGAYKDPNDFANFFPRIAIDPETFFTLYPEFELSKDQLAAFIKERNACIVGRKIAREHGFKIGDIITVEGDIYPGTWDFVVRGIYEGRDATVDETQMLFQWKYLDEKVGQTQPGRKGEVGWYVLSVTDPKDLAPVSRTIDDMYTNSRATTKTETEREWQQSFVSMSSAIITSITVVSYVIIGIILLILSNTIIMATRERIREYAVLKTLGFSAMHIIGLIGGESLLISVIGGAFGLILTFPIVGAFAQAFPTWFPIVVIQPLTIALAFGSALFAGFIAALFPTIKILRMNIIDGLRTLG
jgi:putative ABC transport system permease protein